MRKSLIILISIFISISFLSIINGCDHEPKYTAEEWEQIQKESNQVEVNQNNQTTTIKNDEFSKQQQEIIEFDIEYKKALATYEKKNSTIKDSFKKAMDNNDNAELDDLKSKFSNFIGELISDLEDIYVPEPLDDFYDKTLEYYNKLQNIIITKDMSKTDEIDELKIEVNRIQREVYREYNLEYLLKD